MAAAAGREAILKKNSSAISGVRVLTVTFAGTPIDITDQDDDGIVTLLAGASATEQLTLSVSGVSKAAVFRGIAMDSSADKLLTDLTFTFADASVLSGDFYMNSYDSGNPYDGAETFSATFVSSGDWSLT